MLLLLLLLLILLLLMLRISKLPEKVVDYVDKCASICQPETVHVCDGSQKDQVHIFKLMRRQGVVRPLIKYDNCWAARSDPQDVARIEHKTVTVSTNKRMSVPIPVDGHKGSLGNWMSMKDMEIAFKNRFPGCMRGRTMYVIPFCMGPYGSPMSRIGIQLTDSPYIVASTYIMLRVGSQALEALGNGEFTKCLHSVGDPLPSHRKTVNNWPCNPEKTLVAHIPENNEIISFGSAYGGNAMLGKKCLGLRLGSVWARDEGWLAENMMIVGVTNPEGQKRYIAAAFPGSCGKTNLSMLQPTLPGYKVECVGDDIAWMWFDDEGQMRAINPQAGFFAVAPGTSNKTNPNAIKTIIRNTLFTNIAETIDGGFYWEGLEDEISPEAIITSWTGEKWHRNSNKLAAHSNARYCVSYKESPILDPNWEKPEGVPIDAILFGGRRPDGVPLVVESLDWKHGVLLGASIKTEPTPASEMKGPMLHDPFSMRPFLGYNFGNYLDYWFGLEKSTTSARPGGSKTPALRRLPRLFNVNFFRKDPADGSYLWPGYGENFRVLDWVCRRLEGPPDAPGAKKTSIGYLPELEHFETRGLDDKTIANLPRMLTVDRDFWLQEAKELQYFFHTQLNYDVPSELIRQLTAQEQRLYYEPMP
ncbi:hypothetical protein HELRODRAFT_156671 [Helobdella robusta]|uniref:phosphoenolpyruvate carboxykinase (GTP) n=1 Tax=Helobdella robusta TaxID=6412 RepID=T1ELZ8_HELRO|nr:hypothetical protein HELRODRAFT_156671 [Helobdella robusta]ESO08189.1 hypothetical protein HELRODRAFT_156671 [Helobdella robusta]